jgi:Type II secretion system (T2SS), protein E, N-terminal domain
VTDDALALAFRTGLPFVGLRDHEHDPDLDRLIPPDAARAARAVPLAADDDHLRLAVRDPEPDLAALSPYLGDLRVELALAAEEEIEAVLGPPPPEPLATHAGPFPTEHPPLEPLAAEPEPFAAEPTPLEPLAAEPEADEPTPLEPLAAPPEAVEPLAAEPTPLEPLAAEPTPLEPLAAQPEAAEPEAAEPLPAHAEAAAPPAADPEAADPEAAEAAPPEPLAAPQASASDVADPELDGEVPSWLEAPRRRGKVALAGFIVAMLLIVAAGAVAAYVLTR